MALYTNAQQRVPILFQAIMDNDDARAAIKSLGGGGMTQEDWRNLKLLNSEKRGLRAAAERVLHWNENKGRAA